MSLLLAPMVASCGVAVPMMSGRGLWHTGGTLDKLESIPGFRTNLTLREAKAQIERLGCCMLGQSPEIAPSHDASPKTPAPSSDFAKKRLKPDSRMISAFQRPRMW